METAYKIASILNKCCPAFYMDKEAGGATWHHCHCRAQTSKADYPQSCTCVWRTTDSCLAGKWPQLAFLNIDQQNAKELANKWLNKAESAILNSKTK